jgi:hypothetical protein
MEQTARFHLPNDVRNRVIFNFRTELRRTPLDYEISNILPEFNYANNEAASFIKTN